MFGIYGKFINSFRNTAIQSIIEKLLVTVDSRSQFLRYREYYMEVRSFQYILPTFIHPLFLGQSLTHRTTSVAARVVMNLWMTAILTDADISTISSSFTVDDAMRNFCLLRRRGIFLYVIRIKPKKNILYGWFTHLIHQLSYQKDFELPVRLCC